jgi:arylsulfatase A-like enzyme
MNLLCLVVDRWHVGYLGCYGNSWVGTPELDRLACESFCFDQALIDTPRLEDSYNSLWRGQHALSSGTATPSLMQVLAQAGISSTLLTDERAVADHPLAADFGQRLLIELSNAAEPVNELEETGLARFFAAASDWLAQPREPFLLWLHTTGMGSTWDAPLALRNHYVEEEEPLPPQTVDVPCRELPEDADPDELLGIRRAYAGQALVLDTCIGAIDRLLGESSLGERTILAVLSARGFPLGEHRSLGACGDALYAELVHVPWLLRFPDRLGAAGRSQSLVQPADLMPTLLETCGLPPSAGLRGTSLMSLVRGESERVRDRALIVARAGERAVRTPAWHLRVANGRSDAVDAYDELYVKPDDRWEVNEVSGRCPEVVEGLRRVLAESEQSHQTGLVAQQPLEEMLLNGLS